MTNHPEYFKERFKHYSCKEDYESAGIRFCEPMTAKEIETEEEQDLLLSSPDYYVEEKFDGTRATLHFTKDAVRVFSRRISVKTGWFCENSDLVPQIRDIILPELEGTVLDGEMFIPDRPFKDVASTLNCSPDKAVSRQFELGFIVLHAFDILYYKGRCIEHLPLVIRKQYLRHVIRTINSPYIVEVPYYSCDDIIPVHFKTPLGEVIEEKFPNLYASVAGGYFDCIAQNTYLLTPKAYYEYIVYTGGEGVIVKPKWGHYFHKRGREYQKIKKFTTRDLIVVGFSEPTRLYEGKFSEGSKHADGWWSYWEDPNTKERFESGGICSAEEHRKGGLEPVTKYYFLNQVGNIRLGVIITPEEAKSLTQKKGVTLEILSSFPVEGKKVDVLLVGECSGFDEDTRKFFTDNKDSVIGSVVEVKAQEVFKDTGKMRHPRYLRLRSDKSPLQCIWADHVL